MLLKLKLWIYIYIIKSYYGYFKVSAKCIYAQAVHETGGFTSAVYQENKNLFGMRQPSKRKTKAIGTNKNHAIFKNHYESVVDYFLRQKYFNIPNSTDTIYMGQTLKSNYAEDKNYLPKWQLHIKNMKKPVLLTFITYGGLFFLLISFILIGKQTQKNAKK